MNTLFNGTGFGSGNGLDLHALNKPEFKQGYSQHSAPSKSPVELLENQLNKKLSGFAPVNQVNTADFTPKAVADRILGFVETAINQRAGSELEAQSMLQQAKEGISQGFEEAREILSAMPQMTDEIAAQIDETESLVFKGLESIGSTTIDTPRQQQIGRIISESGSLTSQFKQSSQATIEIVTQDGDKVEVSYSAFIESASSQQYSSNQQGESASFEYSNISSASFQFSVQGNIDEGEKQAINELLNNVGDLANQFFNGDVQAAFNSAMELGIDNKELKSFALDFQQSTYVEVMQTYQRTELIDDSVASRSGGGFSPAPAINVLSQLEELIEVAKENALIEQPEKAIKSLLTDMLDLLKLDVDLPVKNYIKSIIDDT
ncbi:MAG: hypothetical protein DIZ80_03885 [endosymbiont of Galathealinum brachiosum]|uniref:DUF5610 domain-containing protein n=1 Tax=endosymbiont of Galathealinum brachiosum TaxID=2200906 RepID=A0A370DI69_9GAMM|nr:MAG: hypothetical protein DIZ80_03885 [endosymbiont of Galathealinum brachiosum]